MLFNRACLGVEVEQGEWASKLVVIQGRKMVGSGVGGGKVGRGVMKGHGRRRKTSDLRL